MSELAAHDVHCLEPLPLCLAFTDKGLLVVPSCDGGESRAAAGEGSALAVWTAADHSELRWQRFVSDALKSERPLGVDQTNESWILSDRAVIKWPLFATTSVSAEKELLLQQAGFSQTPALWGHLWWQATDETQPLLVATVTEFIPDSVDGWTWAPDALTNQHIGWATTLGQLAADMHSALRVGRAATYMSGEAPVAVLDGTETQLVHGDFHLGQILRRGDDFYVIDFDGDPMKSVADNLHCKSVWTDVASMSSSIIHAGMVALKRGASVDAIYPAISEARAAFLDAYILASHKNPDRGVLSELVNQIEQRELAYASQYLPRWLYAPEGAIKYLRTVGEL